MPIQYEIPILASLGAPKDEPTAWVHATSFEECVRLAFERGRKRYDLKTIGRLAGIHAPLLTITKRSWLLQHIY